ncbi:sigma-70 family RNA polymerase sigma factor [soil metagenome]
MHQERLPHLHPTVWSSFKSGDKEAYALLYETYFSRLYNYGYKFTKDQLLVEDAIQDLFVKLWQHRESLGCPASVTNYLYKSLRGILFNKLTRGDAAFQHPANLEDYRFEVVPSPEADLIQSRLADDRREQLAKALAALTPRQREAIFLKFYEGLSYEEVADIMAVTVKAVYKITARALVTLKSSLTKMAALYLAAILLFPFFR